MNINPIIWLVIGAAVTGVSLYIGDKLQLFFYVGVAFIVWGVFRTILYFILRDEPKPVRKTKPTRYVCYKCKSPVEKMQSYCTHCGSRLR